MLLDRNKGITSIEYNHLNLPRRINFATGGNIIYIYNAQGAKLQKTVSYPNQTQATTRYRGGFQYDNQTLQFVHTAEGYAKHTPNPTNGSVYGAFDYVYNYTDHLGNIRLSYVLDPAGEGLKVMEENHYYPFGLKHSYNLNKRDIGYFDHLLALALDPTEDTRRTRMVNNNGYQYRYNGKEYQDELGLNMYDYGARNYDPAIGRWMNIDPKAEEDRRWTPYRYAYNNPLRFIDPDGMLETDFGVNEKGEVKQIGPTDNKPDRLFAINNDGSIKTDVKPITVSDKELLPQLESEKNIASTENHGEKISGPIANTDNLTDSYNVFKFAAENSNVEWSLQNYTDGTSSVGTANDNSVTITGEYHKSNKGKVVALDIHSHPNSTTKDLKPSNIDHYRAQRFVEKNKNAKVQLFMPKAPNPNARMLDLVKNKWILNY